MTIDHSKCKFGHDLDNIMLSKLSHSSCIFETNHLSDSVGRLNGNFLSTDLTSSFPWLFPGFSLAFPWLFPGFYLAFPWLSPGFSLTFPWLFLPFRVAVVTADLPSPHRPVHFLARSQPSKSRWHASFHLVVGRPLFLFPGISVHNTFLGVCSSSLLIKCPHQFNLLSVIFLTACITLVVPRMCSFLILSLRVTPHILRSHILHKVVQCRPQTSCILVLLSSLLCYYINGYGEYVWAQSRSLVQSHIHGSH